VPEFSDLAPAGEDHVRNVALARAGASTPGMLAWLADARDYASRRVALIVMLSFVALGAGAFWYHAGTRAAVGDAASNAVRPRAPTRAVRTTTSAGTADPARQLLVHVSGAVVRAGLYRLPADARVADAIAAAGGATANADTDRINLAARVADGQHVIVPRHGDPAPAESGDGDGSTGDPSAPVSLNGASAAQLEALPHVGPALARAIIDYRERHGGFKSVHELRNIRGIGERVYADLVDRVTL